MYTFTPLCADVFTVWTSWLRGRPLPFRLECVLSCDWLDVVEDAFSVGIPYLFLLTQDDFLT